jgi:hypothetical protein
METPLVQEKPREVKFATTLLWTCLGVGLVNSVVQFEYLRSQASTGFVLTVAGITLTVLALLIWFISAGRNWARITFLILFLLGLIPAIPQLASLFERSVLSGVISIGQWLLQIVAMYLVFSKPGATWFSKRVRL